jgi:murein DD-endopeptidase MepM/ murein hydrolase activator NlpD
MRRMRGRSCAGRRWLAVGLWLGLASALAAPPASASSLGDRTLPPDTAVEFVQVHDGDTLRSLMMFVGIAANQAQAAIDALGQVWEARALKIGQDIALAIDGDGLVEMAFAPGLDRDVSVHRAADGHFTAETKARRLSHRNVLAAGVIHTSLFDAAREADVPMPVLDAVVHAFSYDVDFQRDLKPGDAFEVLFDRLYDPDGRAVGNGGVAYAALTLSGKTKRLYRYLAPGGVEAEFYTERGECAKKALLRTPVDGARLTSGFGMRSHPILGYTRFHRGVDFGAPSGAPIMASGNAIVEKAEFENGYGNFVLLRHNSSFETAYAHMSRVVVRAGARVKQGQVIGFVGATGLATGPHLHYEVRINGVQVDPAGVKMEPGQQLTTRQLAAFRAAIRSADTELMLLRREAVVAELPAPHMVQ